MRIFVLEDCEERAHWFTQTFVNHELVICNNAPLAIQILDTFTFDLLFLDHDLEGEAFVDSNHHNTGFAVAEALPRTRNAATPVIIHSYNPDGAEKMLSVLGQLAKRIPFDKLDLRDILSN